MNVRLKGVYDDGIWKIFSLRISRGWDKNFCQFCDFALGEYIRRCNSYALLLYLKKDGKVSTTPTKIKIFPIFCEFLMFKGNIPFWFKGT